MAEVITKMLTLLNETGEVPPMVRDAYSDCVLDALLTMSGESRSRAIDCMPV